MNPQPPIPPTTGDGVPVSPGGSEPPPLLHIERLSTPPTRSSARGPVPWIAGIVSGLVLVGGGIVLGIGIGSSGNAGRTEVAGGIVSTPAATTAAATPTGTPTATPTPAATPTTSKPSARPTYRTLSARQWKLLAKDPDSYVGRTYLVYGVVTQFDAATGDDTFRADVGPKNMADDWDYETNTLLTGTTRQLRNVVDDDEFRANVTVLGSFSYDTQVGGNTTVPLLRIDSIRIL
ncbi:hypothetical protein [Plantactinospora sp. B5E13]|uniref:hypothetical protein n=1 Tax=Plantactinospora sp. B5E13 TaxID=3153758 RepID=UPI00325DE845